MTIDKGHYSGKAMDALIIHLWDSVRNDLIKAFEAFHNRKSKRSGKPVVINDEKVNTV